jgi:hypothetical protein
MEPSVEQISLCPAGLPDVLFSDQNPNFGQILDGFEMESVDMFYGPLVCFSAIGISYGHLVYFGFV